MAATKQPKTSKEPKTSQEPKAPATKKAPPSSTYVDNIHDLLARLSRDGGRRADARAALARLGEMAEKAAGLIASGAARDDETLATTLGLTPEDAEELFTKIERAFRAVSGR